MFAGRKLLMALKYVRSLVLLILLCFFGQKVEAEQRADSLLMQYLRGEGLPAYDTHDVQYFTNGLDLFDSLILDIDQARHRVWLEFFIFASDSVGTLVMDHLVQAAQRGCDVRVVTDYYKDRERHFGMSRPEYADSLAQLGVDFQMFDRYKVISFAHVARDHRKIVNIDDHIGYIGGLNIADYYVHGNPRYGGWRDMHARLIGPAIEGMAQLFHDQYAASGGLRPYSFGTNTQVPSAVSSGHAQAYSDIPASCRKPALAQVVYFERSRVSKQKKAETRRALIAAFDAAQDTILLVTPYLMPTHTVRQAMIRALDRGVHMEVLFSKVGDIELISSGNYHFANRLVRHGAKVFLYKGEFHHSKIMMVDGQFSMVGSANLNSRSLKWDYEASSFLFGHEVTQQLTDIFEQDKLSCDTLSPRYYRQNYSLGFKLKGWFSDRFLTPFL